MVVDDLFLYNLLQNSQKMAYQKSLPKSIFSSFADFKLPTKHEFHNGYFFKGISLSFLGSYFSKYLPNFPPEIC